MEKEDVMKIENEEDDDTESMLNYHHHYSNEYNSDGAEGNIKNYPQHVLNKLNMSVSMHSTASNEAGSMCYSEDSKSMNTSAQSMRIPQSGMDFCDDFNSSESRKNNKKLNSIQVNKQETPFRGNFRKNRINSSTNHNDDIVDNHGDDEKDITTMQCYKIVYRGVIALMTESGIRSSHTKGMESTTSNNKTGAYLSYGDVIASSTSFEIPISANLDAFRNRKKNETVESHSENDQLNKNVPQSPPSIISETDSSTVASSTSKSKPWLPLAPSGSLDGDGISTVSDKKKKHTRIVSTVTALQVDKVFTGGYAVDVYYKKNGSNNDKSTNNEEINSIKVSNSSQNSCTTYPDKSSKRSNSNADFNNEMLENDAQDKDTTSQQHTIQNLTSTYETSKEQRNHHGFIYVTYKGIPIAQKIDPPSLCESGDFTYQVCSNIPIPILAGPCEDAPVTKAMVLPGTIHQISLKFKSESHSSVLASEKDLEAPTFLRLSHRRGWLPMHKIINQLNKPKQVIEVLKEITVSNPLAPSLLSLSTSFSSYHFLNYTSASKRLKKRRPPRRVMMERMQNISRRKNLFVDQNMPTRCETSSSITTTNFDSVDLISPTNKSLLSDADESFISTGTRNHDLDSNTSNSSATLSNSHFKPSHHVDVKNHSLPPPSFFLMRVHAPLGLKILDAPQFQVNKLIHGNSSSGILESPSSSITSTSKPQSSSTSTTTSIFQNITSVYNHAYNSNNNINSDSGSQKTTIDSYESTRNRSRVLPRGSIFEAAKRMESAGIYTPGAALIKLSDNSGWAIVPHEEDLMAQYHQSQSYSSTISMSMSMASNTNESNRISFEEIGNAISNAPASTNNSQIWLRVFPRAGVYVTCPPPPPVSQPPAPYHKSDIDDNISTQSQTSSVFGSSSARTQDSKQQRQRMHDSETSSSVGSSTSMFFRTPRKDNFITRPQSEHIAKMQSRTHSSNLVLPCGMCVQVDPWEVSRDSSSNSKARIAQNFARLSGAQGWIPLQIKGELYSFPIDPPKIRQGSFWFRVLTKRGIKVRQGPSRRAASIQSEKGYSFRFECGEFLRASEIITIFGTPDAAPVSSTSTSASTSASTAITASIKPGSGNSKQTFSECFAKLYRNSKSQKDKLSPKSKNGEDKPSLRSLFDLATPGEWVQVHINGKHYLEECEDPPSITRNFDGWRYHTVRDTQVRRGPSFSADELSKSFMLKAGDRVLVNERVTAFQDKVTWLRLKDGRGWVHDVGPNDELIMITHSITQRNGRKVDASTSGVNRHLNEVASTATTTTSYNSIISRLFSNDNSNSDGKISQ